MKFKFIHKIAVIHKKFSYSFNLLRGPDITRSSGAFYKTVTMQRRLHLNINSRILFAVLMSSIKLRQDLWSLKLLITFQNQMHQWNQSHIKAALQQWAIDNLSVLSP